MIYSDPSQPGRTQLKVKVITTLKKNAFNEVENVKFCLECRNS